MQNDSSEREDNHAWLLEDISEGRVRILTQESQKGKPAKDLFNSKPDIINQGHQADARGVKNTKEDYESK